MTREQGAGQAGAHLVAASPGHSQHPALLTPGQDGAPAEAHALQAHGVHHGVPALRQVPQAQLQVSALTAKTEERQAVSLPGEPSARPAWADAGVPGPT